MSIEWIQLSEAELTALYTFETHIHPDTDDVIKLDNFIDVGSICVCEVTYGFNPHVYWYRSEVAEDIIESIDIDKRLHKLSPTNNWWELDEDDISILYQDDAVSLNGDIYNLSEFRLCLNEYGEEIFVADAPNWRYFFFRSSWQMQLEEDY